MNLIEFKPEWQNDEPLSGQTTGETLRSRSQIPVLVAEDDPVSRAILVATLRGAGYDPIVTNNGREAMIALRLQPGPCVAIVDWMMPEMDGAEVCRRIRESGKPVHVIMLTARAGKEATVEALDGGADDYLTKPFDRGELLARVRAALRPFEAQLAQRRTELEQNACGLQPFKLQLPL